MRVLLPLLFLLLCIRLLYAQEPQEKSLTFGQEETQLIQHLPGSRGALHAPAIVERNFINLLAGRASVIRHITTSPVGINGKPNEIIRATYGGNERVCINTGSGPGASTTWNCVTVGAP